MTAGRVDPQGRVMDAGPMHPFVTQQMADEATARYEAEAMAQGMPVKAARALKEQRGGDCAVCHAPYKRIEVDNQFGRFVYHRAVCDCEQDADEREERAREVEQQLIEAGVPEAYRGETFETWDWGTTDDRKVTNDAMKQVADFCDTLAWMTRGLVLYGPVGTGKTRLAVCVARAAAKLYRRVAFVRCVNLVGEIIARGRQLADQVRAAQVVVLDDIDKLPVGNEWVRDLVFGLVDGVLGDRRCAVLTTNLMTVDQMEARFGAAVVSRLMGGGYLIEVPGQDYRMRQAEMRFAAAAKKGGR